MSKVDTIRSMAQLDRVTKCCVCGKKFTQTAGTWSRVLPTGSEQRWHVECDRGQK